MSESIDNHQNGLAVRIEQWSGQDGVHTTAIPSLFLLRKSFTTEPIHGVYKPSICIIVQGEKEIMLAQKRFTYGPADYLVVSADLPVTGQVIQASSSAPYLALKLEFTPSEILEVLGDSNIQVEPKKETKRAMFVSKIDTSLLDAVTRLVYLLDNPKDIPILAPLFTKEILYKVLQGPYGSVLEQMVAENSYTSQVRAVIEQLTNHYDKPIRIEELAGMVSMSVPSLYRHFKEVTAMTPIQFQKHLRLQEARRLLVSESADAADAGFQVGYESPSQFSREYSRMFGFPPKEDVKRLKLKNEQMANA